MTEMNILLQLADIAYNYETQPEGTYAPLSPQGHFGENGFSTRA